VRERGKVVAQIASIKSLKKSWLTCQLLNYF